MDINPNEREWLFTRSQAIGVPREISLPIIQLAIVWCESSGIEWTISRFKQLKIDFLRKKAGLPPVSTWIAKSKRDKRFIFSGPFKGLERWSDLSESNFIKAIQLLQLYTNFISDSVTKNQEEKFVSGVLALPVPIPTSIGGSILSGFKLSGIRSLRLKKARPLLEYPASRDKRGPTPWIHSAPEEETLIDSLIFLSLGDGPEHAHKYESLYSSVFQGLHPESINIWSIPAEGLPEIYSGLVVGKIGLIQEPGFKLRAVANPGRVFQAVLQPLGDALFDTIKDLPWDCTFDQSKGDNAICEALREGRLVHSVDLTGATDYFPLDLQLECIRCLLPEDSLTIDLFRDVSRGLWYTSLESGTLHPSDDWPEVRTLQWKKGQPLGLYPSFASFAFTHGILLLGLLGRPWNGEFFVLGDDVVILDELLYAQYREALCLLGCPVSDSKTLVSRNIGEFRNRIYTRYGSYPQLKWRKPSDDSFVDICRLLGPRSRDLLTYRQRRVVDQISDLPDLFGGLGWNTKGIPLFERIIRFIPILWEEEQPLDRLTDYNNQVTRRLYEGRLANLAAEWYGYWDYGPRDLTFSEDLDQRSMSLVQEHLGEEFSPWVGILGKNLDLVLHSQVDLPIPGVRRLKRRSSLEVWESTLRFLLEPSSR